MRCPSNLRTSDGLLNQDLNMCSAEASIRNAAAIPGYVLR